MAIKFIPAPPPPPDPVSPADILAALQQSSDAQAALLVLASAVAGIGAAMALRGWLARRRNAASPPSAPVRRKAASGAPGPT